MNRPGSSWRRCSAGGGPGAGAAPRASAPAAPCGPAPCCSARRGRPAAAPTGHPRRTSPPPSPACTHPPTPPTDQNQRKITAKFVGKKGELGRSDRNTGTEAPGAIGEALGFAERGDFGMGRARVGRRRDETRRAGGGERGVESRDGGGGGGCGAAARLWDLEGRRRRFNSRDCPSPVLAHARRQ